MPIPETSSSTDPGSRTRDSRIRTSRAGHRHQRRRGLEREPDPAGRQVRHLAVHGCGIADGGLPDRRSLHPGAELRRADRIDPLRR